MCPGSPPSPGTQNQVNKIAFVDEYEYIDQLLSKAAYENGDCGEQFKDFDWSWVDPELNKEGKKFIDKYLFGAFMGLLVGIGTGGSIPSLLTVATRTGKFLKYDRHLRTILSFFYWIQLDQVNDTSSPIIQNMFKVRKTHRGVFKLMSTQNPPLQQYPELNEAHKKLVEAIHSDLSSAYFQPRVNLPKDTILSLTPTVWMSQLDMILALFTLFGLIIGYPEKCGISEEDINSPGYKGVIQFSAIIAKICGVSDKWNFGLPHHPVDPKLACQRIWTDLYIPATAQISEYTLSTIREALDSYKIFRLVKLHSAFFLFTSKWMDVESANIYNEMNWFDKLAGNSMGWFISKYRTNNMIFVYLLNKITTVVLFVFSRVSPI